MGDTVEYWKQQYEEAKAELDEFKETSQEYEKELETELAQKEGQFKDERKARERAERELEQVKEKLGLATQQAGAQIAELQEALHCIMTGMQAKTKELQALEQSHDMLEQAERRTESTLADLEMRLEAVIERNAFLEDENITLETELQHMREELRDCLNELAVLHNRPAPPSPKRIAREQRPPADTKQPTPQPLPRPSERRSSPPKNLFNMNEIMSRVMDLEKKIMETRTSIWALGQKDDNVMTESGGAAPKPFNEAAADFFKNGATFFKKMGSLSSSPKDAPNSSNSMQTSLGNSTVAGAPTA